MQTTVFKLEITLGNDAMQTPIDVGTALKAVGNRIQSAIDNEPMNQYIFDANGNCVGTCKTTKRRER
ncbi:MAG: hypothetical protein OEQ39_04510 [Gammaproteobacteria bacterium]|nr:hypothetical protein [Gammaproteobacteria bacterium]